jgi:hypothetical protein
MICVLVNKAGGTDRARGQDAAVLVNNLYGGRVRDKGKQQKGQHARQRRYATTASC